MKEDINKKLIQIFSLKSGGGQENAAKLATDLEKMLSFSAQETLVLLDQKHLEEVKPVLKDILKYIIQEKNETKDEAKRLALSEKKKSVAMLEVKLASIQQTSAPTKVEEKNEEKKPEKKSSWWSKMADMVLRPEEEICPEEKLPEKKSDKKVPETLSLADFGISKKDPVVEEEKVAEPEKIEVSVIKLPPGTTAKDLEVTSLTKVEVTPDDLVLMNNFAPVKKNEVEQKVDESAKKVRVEEILEKKIISTTKPVEPEKVERIELTPKAKEKAAPTKSLQPTKEEVASKVESQQTPVDTKKTANGEQIVMSKEVAQALLDMAKLSGEYQTKTSLRLEAIEKEVVQVKSDVAKILEMLANNARENQAILAGVEYLKQVDGYGIELQVLKERIKEFDTDDGIPGPEYFDSEAPLSDKTDEDVINIENIDHVDIEKK